MDPDSGILVNIDGSMQEHQEREDLFVDASDQLGTGGRTPNLGESAAMVEVGETSRSSRSREQDLELVQARLDASSAECRKYKEEREAYGREVVSLRTDLRNLMNKQFLNSEDQRLNADGAVLDSKDEEIEDLNAKIFEADVFRDVLISYLGSVKGDYSQTMHECINAIKSRLLASILAMDGTESVSSDEFVDVISLIEKRTMLLVEKHNKLSLEVEQFGQFVEEMKPGSLATQENDLGLVFAVAREELLDRKKKEGEVEERIRELEEENTKMADQIAVLNENKEEADAEIIKIKSELVQSETRFSAAKEKLSIAVTKGKQLVQHRDLLKQSLAENTTKLDNYAQDLQLKAKSLETLEAGNEELKQLLSVKTCELEQCLLELQNKSNILEISESTIEDQNQLLHEKTSELEKCLLDLQLKSDAFNMVNTTADEFKQLLAENKDQLENCLLDLQEKTVLASNKDKVIKDIEEITHGTDFPQDLLSLDIVDKVRWLVTKTSISDEILEENRRAKNALFSVGMPETISSTELDDQVEWLVRSFTQSKDELSKVQSELTHNSTLHEFLLKEKEEKQSLIVEHEYLKANHDKLAGNLALVSSEKERFIDFLKEVTETEFDDHLSLDMDAMLEKFAVYLSEKMRTSLNDGKKLENMQKLLHLAHVELALHEKIVEELLRDGSKITSLSDELGTALEEVSALRNEKESMLKEMERLEEKNSLIRDKLSMAVKKGKGLVQEREGFKLTLFEKNSEIEKLEVDITSLKDGREELEHLLNESNGNLKKLVDFINDIIVNTDKIFEDPIEKVDWIAGHINEIENAKAYLEQEVEKVKVDATLNFNRFSEALETMKLMEMELDNKEKHIHNIYEEKNSLQISKSKAEEELEKAREESFMQANTMKSLKDALLLAEDKVSALDSEKNKIVSESNVDISALNAKVVECLEELAKTRGNSENQSAELLSELEKLHIFMKNEGLFPLMVKQFHTKAEGLRHMWMLVQDIHDNLVANGLHVHAEMEQIPDIPNLSSLPSFEDFINTENFHTEAIFKDAGDVTSCTKIVEKIYQDARLLNDRFTALSTYIDDHVSFTSQALRAAKDESIRYLHLTESLKINIEKLEARNQAQEFEISSLQTEATRLLSACTNATHELQFKVSDLLGFDSEMEDGHSGRVEKEDDSKFALASDNLSLTCRKIIIQSQNLVKINKDMSISVENLKQKLNLAELTSETTINERKLIQERALKLEGDMISLQNICNEMKAKLNDYQSKEDLIKNKEAELERMEHSLMAESSTKDELISNVQVEVLFDKVNKLIVQSSRSQELYFSNPIDKLFYVVDKFSEFQSTICSLTCEKEDLQLTLASNVREIENLKNSADSIRFDHHDLELKKSELSEVTSILEKIIQNLAGNNSFEDLKPGSALELIRVFERQMVALSVDLENYKSEIQEFGGKLQAKDLIINELSTKVKYFEDSYDRIQQPDIKERNVFEPSTAMMRLEITEIDEAGSVGMSSKPATSASAHARTARKGSNEHLVLNIDSDSEQLIASHGSDDKGHIFKSLNTSGLIPKQGRLIADRVDGIWVSGGRMLMSKPGARLGLIGYWIFLHLWLLGSIL